MRLTVNSTSTVLTWLTVWRFKERLPGTEVKQNSQTYIISPLSHKHTNSQFIKQFTYTLSGFILAHSGNFRSHCSSWPITRSSACPQSSCQLCTGGLAADLGGPGSVLLNSTFNHTTWALTRCENGHRTVQNGVNLWRWLCSLKGAPPDDDDSGNGYCYSVLCNKR